ncbi:DUF4328 domain-containing protein [Streptomyces natalensis]|uniref:DUF4328 domain-containing protein n=1 Tax=Streptomyces natalensis ATCC 27448 TaxID=1240678 RepID=A0A0D7CGZ9_9ACTN|nr:DUF4328 domain-containing protein [Streptomyces natalensis]KIZ15306.1 hypothetical protein SNA_27405 [Streptomyces natalensis ATCC 27448]
MSHMPVAPPPPPPSPSWSAPPGPQAVLRSPVGLSKAVVILLRLVIVTDLFALWQGNHSYRLVGRLIDDVGSVTSREINEADHLYQTSGILQAAATLATAVVFIVWFHRTRVNAEVFAPDHQSKKRGWAIWGWFVPVVNLWFPRRIALDIWTAGADQNSRSTALLNWWWALWIVDLGFGRLAAQRYAKAESPEEIKGALAGLMASDIFNIAAAVLAIFFVRHLTRMQHEKALRGPTV